MNIHSVFSVLALCVSVVACGAKTEEQASAPATTSTNEAKNPGAESILTVEQMDAWRRSRTVAVVFSPAGGGSGSGEVMQELKATNGLLNDPSVSYDVFDPESVVDMKDIKDFKRDVQVSLDRGREVLIDNGGTPESRAKAAELVREITGFAANDAAGSIISKAFDDPKGGYYITPLYSKADVQEQVSKGLIPNAAAQTNSIENFFFQSKSSQ